MIVIHTCMRVFVSVCMRVCICRVCVLIIKYNIYCLLGNIFISLLLTYCRILYVEYRGHFNFVSHKMKTKIYHKLYTTVQLQ